MTDGSNPYAPPPAGGPPTNPSHNPYAPPSARIGTAGGDVGEAEEIRRQYLNHEASIRSVGCLYVWGGIFALVVAGIGVLSLPFVFFMGEGEATEAMGGAGFVVIVILLYGGLGALNYWLGKGLRQLDPKVRTLATVLFVIGLIGFPVGTMLSLYFLYLLHSEKGKRVMTPEYQQIVELTPHIKYKTSWIAWLALILLIAFIITVVVLVSA